MFKNVEGLFAMRYFLWVLLCVITVPVFAQNTILVIGDSLSAAYGMETEQGWVALLQQRLAVKKYPYRIVNASISNDTTSNGLARLPNALASYHPIVTILELGGNDGLRGLPLLVIQDNLQHMIMRIIAAKSKVLVLGVRLPPNYGPEYTQGFQQIFMKLSKGNQIHVVPLFLKRVDDNPKLLQADGIHPTAQAQPQLLENIWPMLKKLI